MNNKLAALCLFALTLGVAQLPAQADLNVAFGRHDGDHDGRWNRREFYDANRYYAHNHPTVVINQRDMDRDYRRLDRDHDGYLNGEEVRTYRNWE
jgi:hypothetical protein